MLTALDVVDYDKYLLIRKVALFIQFVFKSYKIQMYRVIFERVCAHLVHSGAAEWV